MPSHFAVSVSRESMVRDAEYGGIGGSPNRAAQLETWVAQEVGRGALAAKPSVVEKQRSGRPLKGVVECDPYTRAVAGVEDRGRRLFPTAAAVATHGGQQLYPRGVAPNLQGHGTRSLGPGACGIVGVGPHGHLLIEVFPSCAVLNRGECIPRAVARGARLPDARRQPVS